MVKVSPIHAAFERPEKLTQLEGVISLGAVTQHFKTALHLSTFREISRNG